MSRIDFDLASLRGVAFDVDGVLSPATLPMDINGNPLRMVNIKDGFAMQLAVKCGLEIAIITGADCPAIDVRYKRLGVKDVYLKAAYKVPIFEEWLAKRGLKAEEVAFVGDDIPDIRPMTLAGLSVCPADASPDVKAVSRYISPINGGYGVARDLLEQILRAKKQWLTDSRAFGW